MNCNTTNTLPMAGSLATACRRPWERVSLTLVRGCLAVLLLISATLTEGCAVQSGPVFPPKEDTPTTTVLLVSHGWHAGIVLQQPDIKEQSWPRLPVFTDAQYLEIGWGDREYYTASDPGPGAAVKAALLPTSGVLHIVGFHVPPAVFFPFSEIIAIELSQTGFNRMIAHITKSFNRDDGGRVIPLGKGLYGTSRFYASRETYSLCKTCNTWTAATLQAGGCPIDSSYTVDGLMQQARALGTVIQPARERP